MSNCEIIINFLFEESIKAGFQLLESLSKPRRQRQRERHQTKGF